MKSPILISAIMVLLCANAYKSTALSNKTDTVVYMAESDEEILDSLDKNFSTIKTVQTKFREEKTLKIFKHTIILKGHLSLENPDHLAWRIDSPIKYVLVLNGKYALQWDEETDKVQKMKTAGDPIFEAVLGQIELWFSGKFSSLSVDYDMKVVSYKPLKMKFFPKLGDIKGKAIKGITVKVRDDRKYIEEIAIEDVGGDLTRISFYDTVLNAPVSKSEWKVNSGVQ